MPYVDPQYVLWLESGIGRETKLRLERSNGHPGNFWLYMNDGEDITEFIMTPEQLLELCMKGMVAANKMIAEKNSTAAKDEDGE